MVKCHRKVAAPYLKKNTLGINACWLVQYLGASQHQKVNEEDIR